MPVYLRRARDWHRVSRLISAAGSSKNRLCAAGVTGKFLAVRSPWELRAKGTRKYLTPRFPPGLSTSHVPRVPHVAEDSWHRRWHARNPAPRRFFPFGGVCDGMVPSGGAAPCGKGLGTEEWHSTLMGDIHIYRKYHTDCNSKIPHEFFRTLVCLCR